MQHRGRLSRRPHGLPSCSCQEHVRLQPRGAPAGLLAEAASCSCQEHVRLQPGPRSAPGRPLRRFVLLSGAREIAAVAALLCRPAAGASCSCQEHVRLQLRRGGRVGAHCAHFVLLSGAREIAAQRRGLEHLRPTDFVLLSGAREIAATRRRRASAAPRLRAPVRSTRDWQPRPGWRGRLRPPPPSCSCQEHARLQRLTARPRDFLRSLLRAPVGSTRDCSTLWARDFGLQTPSGAREIAAGFSDRDRSRRRSLRAPVGSTRDCSLIASRTRWATLVPSCSCREHGRLQLPRCRARSPQRTLPAFLRAPKPCPSLRVGRPWLSSSHVRGPA